MKVVYQKPSDITEFDIDKFLLSLNKYEHISQEQVEEKLSHYNYNPIHVSILVEIGMELLKKPENKKSYLAEHLENLDCEKFERLRRITGYLVGSLERWNDSKLEELKNRTKHLVEYYVESQP